MRVRARVRVNEAAAIKEEMINMGECGYTYRIYSNKRPTSN